MVISFVEYIQYEITRTLTNPSKSSQEVERSNQRLCVLVEQVVATNRDLSMRLGRLETQSSRRPIADNLSLMTAAHGDTDSRRSIEYHATGLSSSFESFLHRSRAYEHCHFQHSETSLTSSARRSNVLSTFTSLSLADISNISVFSLPIYASDISNSNYYTFGLPRQHDFSETVYRESGHSRTVANPHSTLNQISGCLETRNYTEVIDRQATKPRNKAKNRHRLLFQSIQRRAEKQQPIQRVDGKEAQTPEEMLAQRPASDDKEIPVPESPQVKYDLGEQHHVAKSTLQAPEPVLQGEPPTSPVYKFETHARTCASCHNPYEVYRLGKCLCDEGHELAQELACFLYSNVNGHEDSKKIEGLYLRSYFFPPDYVQVRGLLRATEELLQDRRPKQMSSPQLMVAQLFRFKNRELRSRARQSTDSLTDSIEDYGSNLAGKVSQSQRPRASSRVSYHSDRNQGSSSQVDYRRRSIIWIYGK